MDIRVGVLGYGKLTEKIKEFMPYISSNVDLILKDGMFDDALLNAKKLEEENLVDVFVSAGGNSAYIKDHLKLPYVEIKTTGFDILFALKKAMKFTDKVGIITFSDRLKYLSEIKDVLKIEVYERTYETKKELIDIFEEFKDLGISNVIGGSLVCQMALNKGLNPHFIYSRDGILSAINHAAEIAEARNIEIKKAKELETILEFTNEGIIVTDQKGVIKVFNKRAEEIVGVEKQDVIGKNVKGTIENTRLDKIIIKGSNELNQIQIVNNKKLLTNRVAIKLQDEIIGALATFKTIGEIREAEHSIRRTLYKKGFIAKYQFEDIIGTSSEMEKVITKAKVYANSDSTILLQGESGTGKELFAQSIHNHSSRYNEPFVAINCAAIPPNLLESELFGYEEGAFTGAKKGGKYGVFELANNGTVFLDEIGEMPIELQARLLRVLEEKEIFRLGDDKVINVDVRIIAATNKDLLHMVKEGTFREDLYYRVNVLELAIPPLRDRKEDIPLLLELYINKFTSKINKDDMEYILQNENLVNYKWPGNVREIRNIAERISVLYENYEDISVVLNLIDLFNVNDMDRKHEKETIINVLNMVNGNKTQAAKFLGIGRTTLWRKMNEYNIE